VTVGGVSMDLNAGTASSASSAGADDDDNNSALPTAACVIVFKKIEGEIPRLGGFA